MKRKSFIAILAAIMVMASAAISCAATDLHVVSSFPKDGQKNTSMENLGVKVVFNNKVNDEKIQKANMKAVKLVDEEGKNVPIEVLVSNKGGKMILVVADTNNSDYKVLNNAEYTLTIGESFKDNDGNTLGTAETVSFKTYNQKANTWVNMGMMVVMFGGLFLVTARSNNKKEEEKEEEALAETFNPYKEAKRTGKTVDEVKAEQAKREEKLAKKKAKKSKDEPVYEKHIENCAELLNNVYHVHAPAPISKEDRSIEALEKMRKDKKAAAKAAQAAKAKKRRVKK